MVTAEHEERTQAVESRYSDPGRAPSEPAVRVTKGDVRMPAASRGDVFARVMGFMVFLLGVAIILGVLKLGFDMYRDPTLGLRFPKGYSPTPTEIGTSFVRLIVRIGLLFFFSISGSLIANKGINMYFTALRRSE